METEMRGGREDEGEERGGENEDEDGDGAIGLILTAVFTFGIDFVAVLRTGCDARERRGCGGIVISSGLGDETGGEEAGEGGEAAGGDEDKDGDGDGESCGAGGCGPRPISCSCCC